MRKCFFSDIQAGFKVCARKLFEAGNCRVSFAAHTIKKNLLEYHRKTVILE